MRYKDRLKMCVLATLERRRSGGCLIEASEIFIGKESVQLLQ